VCLPRFQRAVVAVLSGIVLFAILSAPAVATEPARYELPKATHAGPLAISTDGTVWFVPSRGSEWEGDDEAVIGRLAPSGAISEHQIAGFSVVSGVAIGPEDTLWVAGYSGDYRHKTFEVSRLSSTGESLGRYTVGRGPGGVWSLTASSGAVWLISERSAPKQSLVSITRISIATGEVRHFPLPPKCHASVLDVAPDGTPWFTQKCGGFLSDGAASKTSISRIGPDGKIVRRWIAATNYPVSLAIGPDGTVWFGAWRYYDGNRIGRLTNSGTFAEFRITKGSPWSIAVGPEGRLWFPSTFRRGYTRALNSIGLNGQLGVPVCADPSCELQPGSVTRAADGSLWYGLTTPNYNTGGGGSGLFIQELIANEAGFLGHLIS
jgi:streptogramin lyase